MIRVRRPSRWLPLVVLAAFAASCGDGSTDVEPPAKVQASAGNDQSGSAGEALPTPLAVRVLDAGDRPVSGVTVTWAVTAGGGSISPQTSSTDANGVATSTWTLGAAAGPNTAMATVPGLAAVTFTATGRAVVTRIILTPDSTVMTSIGDTFRISAAITDRSGNTVPATAVTWSSSNTAVAIVSELGTVTSQGNGSALVIAAAAGGPADTVRVRVQQAVVEVRVSAPEATVEVGDSIRLTVSAVDARGVEVQGVTVALTSSNTSVATVSANSWVRGVSTGSATITAAAGGKSAALQLSVVPLCQGLTPVSLAVGQVTILTAGNAAALCLSAPAAGAEFVAVPQNTALSGSTSFSIEVKGRGIETITAAAELAASRSQSGGLAQAGPLEPDLEFEARLRGRERAELTPRLRAAPSFRTYEAGTPRLSMAAPPNVGDLLTLNVSTADACSNPDNRVGRVVAVSANLVVVADTSNPADGFTTADYEAIAATFDTLIHQVDTLNFGAPADINTDGRVIAFYTKAVNQLTPAGSTSFVGGFFFSRDLFPKVATARFQACATSNVAELFYLLVPDSTGTVNGNVRTKGFVNRVTLGTIAHEFEHLINASRRMYISNASQFEEVWLDEGLAHIAEELVFYDGSGSFSPRTNLTRQSLTTPHHVTMFNTYMAANFGRLNDYLPNTEGNAPFRSNVDLGSRGAAWQWLRYLADQKGGSETAFWRGLVNTTSRGIANLQGVYGSDLTSGLRNYFVALYTDDEVATTSAFQHPSWHFRNLLAALNVGYRLKTYTLANREAQTVSLIPGAAAYMRFRVGSGRPGFLGTTVAGQAPPGDVTVAVVRTK